MTARVPPLSCPAQHGKGADIAVSFFTLVVDDCENGRDGLPAKTEAWGYFRQPGEEHDDDALVTADLLVPAGSPIAQMARLVGCEEMLTERVGAELRRNVERCLCAASAECPALDELRLVEAIEHALAGGST